MDVNVVCRFGGSREQTWQGSFTVRNERTETVSVSISVSSTSLNNVPLDLSIPTSPSILRILWTFNPIGPQCISTSIDNPLSSVTTLPVLPSVFIETSFCKYPYSLCFVPFVLYYDPILELWTSFWAVSEKR